MKSLIVLISVFGVFITHAEIQEQAQRWIHTYIVDSNNALILNDHDLNIIANVLYYSYQRSCSTIDAQRIMLPVVTSIWHAYENSIAIRLNPSKAIPHPELSPIDLSQFWHLYYEQQQWSNLYARTINLVYNRNCQLLQDEAARDAVRALRTYSRKLMFQSLSNLPVWIIDWLQNRHEQERCRWIESFIQALPDLSVYSFAKADTAHNELLTQAWSTIYTSEDAYATMWEHLEEARATFYATCYNHLANIITSRHDTTLHSISFDITGYIPVNQRTDQLPITLQPLL